ncbi:nitrate- and nitrite sensing domain-containing protein [Actinomycetes bacterium KLBMP 9797]
MTHPRTGNWSIRAKITTLVAVPVAALVALWIFTTVLTAGPALALLDTRAVRDELSRPGDSLVAELQRERRLSLVYLAGSGDLPALAEQRNRTDAAAADFRRRAAASDVREAAEDPIRVRVDAVLTELEVLPAGRGYVDRREMDQAGTLGLYTGIVDKALRLFGALANLDDDQLTQDARTVVALSRAREVLGQSDALLAGAFAARKFAPGNHAQFVQIVGAHRYLYDVASAALPAADRAAYQRITEGEAYQRLRDLETQVVTRGRDGAAVPVSASAWQSAYEAVARQLRDVELATADAITDRAAPVATGVLTRMALAGLLGLAAIAVSLLLLLRVGRSLIRRLTGLRVSALDLADRRLPDVVSRLRRGEQVDVVQEAPPLEYGTDEIGQLGHAFTEAQRTAVQAAVDESNLRRGYNEVFLNIARRSQTLLHRQLTLLDGMERRATEPDELEELFRIDHLATRMRRHAEDLAILAGDVPGRGWRNPVAVLDVIRGAVSEVEEYARVTVSGVLPSGIAGPAVGDLIHLLAELIENATTFSPPQSRVRVTGQPVPNGYAIEIEDRGLGLPAHALEEANRRLARPPDFDPVGGSHLGLFVVAQLGARHGVRIRLKPSPYEGVTAVVLVPPDLVVPAPEEPALPADEGRLRRARTVRLLESRPPQPAIEPPTRRAVESAVDAPTVEARAIELPRRTAGPGPAGAANDGANGRANGGASRRAGDAAAPDGGPAGLPRRVRQASLAPQLREAAQEPVEPQAPTQRTAEQARATMAALQAGTARGRRDAEGDED